MMRFICAAFALVVLSGSTASIPADARRTIEAANHAWLPAMERQDVAAIVEPYADDAVFVTPTGESARGRDAIGRLMRDRFEKSGRVTGGTITQDGLTAVGTMIYEWGHASFGMAREGQPPVTLTGRYLTVWQRSSTGRWQIIRNLSLPD